MITEETPCWWNGCWLTSGHFLFDRHGRNAERSPNPFRGLTGALDSCYAPRRHKRFGSICYSRQCGGFADARLALFDASEELPQGQFLRHHFPARDVTFLAWWDRTQGDERSNCNAVFAVQGDHTSDEMLAWFPTLFPLQAACITKAQDPFRLVEVFVSPTPTFSLRCSTCLKRVYETHYPNESMHTVPAHPPGDVRCPGSNTQERWRPDP